MKDCQYFPEVGKNNWIVTTELVIFGIAIALETKRRGAWKWKKPSPIFNPILWSISISPQRTVTANESSDYSGICCWSGACYVLLAFLFLRLASGWDVLCFGLCLNICVGVMWLLLANNSAKRFPIWNWFPTSVRHHPSNSPQCPQSVRKGVAEYL